ncbi:MULTISPECIES: YeeE/YedE family protein [Shewanella]|uniref:YeeE/YedE family protein n=1 Tax=Shewanella marisflavi TaxID=260364 RepID=A0AAC9TV30_9GAMM|nr:MULTISPECIES: YeeE/YedE thiosulfate transporter family protein [Shewanella]ASJ95730.1 YeeE/YedE family protein [Shewanella marisflavi]MCL1041715.1 YeeE/YedE family protein [Shewanella marisflavi]QDF74293.1 YeeE/YedE family protein [Shewanella marisflavi]
MFSSLAIALCGGLLIGLAASLLLVVNGRIAGISGIIYGALWRRESKSILGWQVYFLAGLVLSGLLLAAPLKEWLAIEPVVLSAGGIALPTLLLAGLLVGIGSSLGNGCTSGHCICGIGRLSPRSIAASLVFMLVGIAAAVLLN